MVLRNSSCKDEFNKEDICCFQDEMEILNNWIFSEDLIKFSGRCVNNKDKNLVLNVVETLNSPDEATCKARCKSVEKVEPLFNACQYLPEDQKCELIYDDVSYGSGESNDAACFVFHNDKFKRGKTR